MVSLNLSIITGFPSDGVDVNGEHDDRVEITDAPTGANRNFESVAAIIARSALVENANGFRIRHAKSIAERFGLCSTQAFAAQPVIAFSGAVLVKPDVLLTASHCIVRDDLLSDAAFVFGYEMQSQVPRTRFKTDDVYNGRLVLRRNEDDDWVLIQLDRPVNGRPPVKRRTTGAIDVGTGLYTLGFPCGLPGKCARNAAVTRDAGRFFVTDLDTFHANSGSPVFNAQTDELEGVFSAGAGPDLLQTPDGCLRWNLSHNPPAEKVSRITNVPL